MSKGRTPRPRAKSKPPRSQHKAAVERLEPAAETAQHPLSPSAVPAGAVARGFDPTEQPQEQTEQPSGLPDGMTIRGVQTDIRASLFLIHAQVPGPVQNKLEDYGRCISARRASEGDSMFPLPLRRHGGNWDRSQDSDWRSLLCFHVGNTIRCFHEVLQGHHQARLLANLKHLKEIANHGPANFQPYGSDQRGWMLMHRDAVQASKETKDED